MAKDTYIPGMYVVRTSTFFCPFEGEKVAETGDGGGASKVALQDRVRRDHRGYYFFFSHPFVAVRVWCVCSLVFL